MAPDIQPKLETRAALIDAALDLFGEQGFAAVSTRALAERAGANLAAIQYHFGGKDALYRAVMDYIVETFRPRIEAAITLFEEQATSLQGNPRRLSQLLETLATLLLRGFLAEPNMKRFLPFLFREMVHPSNHFDHFYASLPARVHALLTRFVALALRTSEQDEATVLQTHALLGQIIVFHIGRAILLRRVNWDDYTGERIDQVIAVVVPMLQRSLGLPTTLPKKGAAKP